MKSCGMGADLTAEDIRVINGESIFGLFNVQATLLDLFLCPVLLERH